MRIWLPQRSRRREMKTQFVWREKKRKQKKEKKKKKKPGDRAAEQL